MLWCWIWRRSCLLFSSSCSGAQRANRATSEPREDQRTESSPTERGALCSPGIHLRTHRLTAVIWQKRKRSCRGPGNRGPPAEDTPSESSPWQRHAINAEQRILNTSARSSARHSSGSLCKQKKVLKWCLRLYVTLLRCHVKLFHCYVVTLLCCYIVTMFRCYIVVVLHC